MGGNGGERSVLEFRCNLSGALLEGAGICRWRDERRRLLDVCLCLSGVYDMV